MKLIVSSVLRDSFIQAKRQGKCCCRNMTSPLHTIIEDASASTSQWFNNVAKSKQNHIPFRHFQKKKKKRV